MKKFLVYLIVILISVQTINAQVKTRFLKNKVLPIGHKIDKSKIKKHTTPRLDVKKLKKADSLEVGSGMPPRFGYAFDANLSLTNSGTWTSLDSGKIWNLKIATDNALSVNLIFNYFHLSKGATLNIYNSDETMIMGPFSSKQNNKTNTFATDIISGNTIILHLFIPENEIEENRIEVGKIIHGYKKVFTADDLENDSENCNNDVDCVEFSNWSDQSASTALILLGNNNTRICSGCLMNNTNNDFRPFFLTAFHCIDMNQDNILQLNELNQSNNWIFRFKYESPSPVCNGKESMLDDRSFIWFAGSVFRAAWRNTDFALLEMNITPDRGDKIFYAGWSRASTALTSGVSIHHPSGDVKKISIENDPATSVSWAGGATDHWRVNFNDGTCEPGSSGGPLFDQNRRVVGQVHGVQGFNPSLSFCDQRRIDFGRFDISWTGGDQNGNRKIENSERLSSWLDPKNIIGTGGSLNGAYQACPNSNLTNRTWNYSTTYSNCQINITNSKITGNSTVIFDAEAEVIINGNFEVDKDASFELK